MTLQKVIRYQYQSLQATGLYDAQPWNMLSFLIMNLEPFAVVPQSEWYDAS